MPTITITDLASFPGSAIAVVTPDGNFPEGDCTSIACPVTLDGCKVGRLRELTRPGSDLWEIEGPNGEEVSAGIRSGIVRATTDLVAMLAPFVDQWNEADPSSRVVFADGQLVAINPFGHRSIVNA